MIINPYMFPGGGPTGPTLVANTFADANGSGNTPSSVITSAINTSGADFLLVSVCYYNGGGGSITSLTDSKSNTWSSVTIYAGPATAIQFYYCAAPVVGSGHTFTVLGGFIYHSVFVAAFSGLDASPYYDDNGASSSSASTLSTGSVTPSTAGSLAIAGVAFDNNSGGAVSIDNSYITIDTDPYAPGATGGSLAYKIVSAATNPQWNITNSAPIAASIAVFDPV